MAKIKITPERKRPRLIRRREVEERTGLSRSSIYARMGLKTFPASIDLGGRAVAWREDEVDMWINHRIQNSIYSRIKAAVISDAGNERIDKAVQRGTIDKITSESAFELEGFSFGFSPVIIVTDKGPMSINEDGTLAQAMRMYGEERE